jgi:hypothetical protein
LEALICFKESTKNKKKAELKSQYIKKSRTKLFKDFYIPEAKMTSSVLISSQGNTEMNKSTIMDAQKDKTTNIDKSLQLKSKMQISQLYQS